MSSISSPFTSRQQNDLQTFQSISGITDPNLSLQILIQHEWNLEDAVNFAFAMQQDGANNIGGNVSTTTGRQPSASTTTTAAASTRAPIAHPLLPTNSGSSTNTRNSPSPSPLPSTSSTSAPMNLEPSMSGSAARRGRPSSPAVPLSPLSPSPSPSGAASSSVSSSPSTSASNSSASASQGGISSLMPGFVKSSFGMAYRLAASALGYGSGSSSSSSSSSTSTSSSSSGSSSPFPASPSVSPDEQRFYSEFVKAYPNHPQFYRGSYNDALLASRDSNRMLFVYLHCGTHDDTPVFCRETLCSPSMKNFLEENFITWIASIHMPEPYTLANKLGAAGYPFVAVLAPHGSNLAVVYRHQGLIDADELITQLLAKMENHRSLLQAQRVKQTAQSATRSLVAEQDREYEEALKKDQERKKVEEEEKRKLVEEKKKKEDEEKKIKDEEERKQRIKQEKRNQLLPEPDPASTDGVVVNVMIRLPNGKRLQRRFLDSHQLSYVCSFIESTDEEDWAVKKYRLMSNFPTRVHDDTTKQLKDLGLGKNIALIVQMED